MRLTIILLLVVLIAMSGFILRQLHHNDENTPIVTRDYVAPTVSRELEQPDPPITAPKRDFRSTIGQLVPQLASDDADTRSAAMDILLSLPGDAQAAVEAAAQNSQSPATAREALQQALPIIQKRAARAQRIRQERDRLGRALLNAYNRYGHHDASWDDRARKIIPAFFALGPMQDRTAQQEAAVMKIFNRLTEYAHCNDSFVQYVYGCALVEFQWGNATRMQAVGSMDAASRDNRSMPSPWPDLFLAGCPTWRGDFFYAGGPADPQRLGPMFNTILSSELLTTESKLACAQAILQDDRDSRHRIVFFRTRPADVDGDFKLLHDALEKALPNGPEPHLLEGYHDIGRAWDARGDDPSQVTEKGRKLFKQHLTEAKDALEKAYEIDPADPRTPLFMLSVGLGLSESRSQMDLWYRRAIDADPDNYQAMQLMLTYLEPRWYGNREALLSFAKACRDTHNYRGRMPLAIVEAQERLANYESDPGQYLREPDVWGQIRSSYESYLTLFPNDRLARTRYLRVAVLTDNWPQANEQCGYLGDHPWPGFYGDSDYQAIRKQAAQASAATSQPATQKSPK